MLRRIVFLCKDVGSCDQTEAIELWHNDCTRGRLLETKEVEELTLRDLDTSVEEI